MRGIYFSYLYIMANNLTSYFRRKALRQAPIKIGSVMFEENDESPSPPPPPTPIYLLNEDSDILMTEENENLEIQH